MEENEASSLFEDESDEEAEARYEMQLEEVPLPESLLDEGPVLAPQRAVSHAAIETALHRVAKLVAHISRSNLAKEQLQAAREYTRTKEAGTIKKVRKYFSFGWICLQRSGEKYLRDSLSPLFFSIF